MQQRVLGTGLMVGVAWMAAACSDDAGTAGTPDLGISIGEPDTGIIPPPPLDAGFPVDAMVEPDSGMFDCTGNPFGCAPMQRLAPDCTCLEACDGGLVWNPDTMMCEEPFAGDCLVDSDCPGPVADVACLNNPGTGGLAACTGEATCECFTRCDPFVPETQTGCPVVNNTPQVCIFLANLDLPEVEAVCTNQGMGARQGVACTNPNQCDRPRNFICFGLSMTSTSGFCQKLCDGTAPPDEFCGSEAGPETTCIAPGFTDFPELGLCYPRPVPVTDYGQMCTMDSDCNGLCSAIIGGCSSDCRRPNLCPEEALCVNFTGDTIPPNQRSICMVNCTGPDAAGDAACQARNPNWICDDLFPSPTSPVCTPGCLAIGCAAGQMCNLETRRCE